MAAVDGWGGDARNSWRARAHRAWANAFAEATGLGEELGPDFDDGDLERVGAGVLIPRMITVIALPHTSHGAASHTCKMS
jgi:hypothetical protein